jgi:hypothetical protein
MYCNKLKEEVQPSPYSLVLGLNVVSPFMYCNELEEEVQPSPYSLVLGLNVVSPFMYCNELEEEVSTILVSPPHFFTRSGETQSTQFDPHRGWS